MQGKRSWEFIAIPVVAVMLGALAIILWAADAGMGAWLAVGIAAVIALVVFAVVYMRRPHHPEREPAPTPSHVDDGIHRVLVIADDDCPPAELGKALAESSAADRTAVLVVAPALGSRTARWTGDDHAYETAQRHLDSTLGALSSLGVDARGHIGSHDPLQAADDGLREFPADEIVFAVHPDTDALWVEEGVVGDARARYSIPVRELIVTRSSD